VPAGEQDALADAGGDSAPAGDGDNLIEAVVEVVEPVGSEIFVNLQWGGHTLVARLPAGPLPRVGGRLPMRVCGGKLHVFDPSSGRRLGS
jgi:multiple sugar transport system ATP-binding protein